MLHADSALLALAVSNAVARAGQHDVKVHAVDTSRRVVLQAEIDVLINAKAKVAGRREILGLQLVLANLGTQLEDLLGALATNGDVGGDFLDLRMLTDVARSNFRTSSAVGYDPLTGHGDIEAYVKILDAADGSHVMFSASGNVATAGTEILSLKFVHGLDAQTLFDRGNIVA